MIYQLGYFAAWFTDGDDRPLSLSFRDILVIGGIVVIPIVILGVLV